MLRPTTAGIVFIDEIDKIVTSSEHRYGGDASAEGVQRDLLPIIEGGCWAQCGLIQLQVAGNGDVAPVVR